MSWEGGSLVPVVSLPPLMMINQNNLTNKLIMWFEKNIPSVQWDFLLIQVLEGIFWIVTSDD